MWEKQVISTGLGVRQGLLGRATSEVSFEERLGVVWTDWGSVASRGSSVHEHTCVRQVTRLREF